MKELLIKVLTIKDIPLRPVLLFWFVSGFILLLPEQWLSHLHVNKLLQSYGKWFGILFIASTAMLIIKIIFKVIRKITNIHIKSLAVAYLKNIDREEQSVLREFYITNQNTIEMPTDDPVVAGLLNNGILYRVSANGLMNITGMLFPLAISEFIQPYLTKEILDIPKEIDDAKHQALINNRPPFVERISAHRDLRYGRW
ncbi:MAG: superinfection exclusion B family protein [Deltaproteobacteria bacterium]|nr:superinfection exclusion B family protein [Deltaproteobacteria bacterium]